MIDFKPNCSRNVLNIYDHTVAVSDQERDGVFDSAAKPNENRLSCSTCPGQETLWQQNKGWACPHLYMMYYLIICKSCPVYGEIDFIKCCLHLFFFSLDLKCHTCFTARSLPVSGALFYSIFLLRNDLECTMLSTSWLCERHSFCDATCLSGCTLHSGTTNRSGCCTVHGQLQMEKRKKISERKCSTDNPTTKTKLKKPVQTISDKHAFISIICDYCHALYSGISK